MANIFSVYFIFRLPDDFGGAVLVDPVGERVGSEAISNFAVSGGDDGAPWG